LNNQDFKMLVVPSYLNPGAPEGETLILIFSIDELERARRRAELTIRNRMEKGITRDEALRSCTELSS
jgi:hypothetical protein